MLPFGCASDPNGPTCDTAKYTYVINRNDSEGRDIMVGDQLQIEFGIFLARYSLRSHRHLAARVVRGAPN